ncbi:hypothetical protein OPQ81_004115 [Rhizoctonia solani]|nr:hypothetical protein OPQ81_004115 [Rhizoctonia solani]
MPSSAPNVSEGNNPSKSLFTPPSGGDITLRSSDGVDFIVHSVFLKFASSTFDSMISTRNTNTTMELTENASEISYLLRFIYPNRFPLAMDPDMLPSCLAVVQKYGVEGAIEMIDQLITLDASPHKTLSSNPVQAYQLAVRFNLVKTKATAARIIVSEGVDFCDLDKTSELVQKYSSPGLIYLMNIQAMRAKLLLDVLFRFNKAPVKPTESDADMYFSLSCADCRRGNPTIFKRIPPSWALAWVQFVYDTLLTSLEPLAKSNYLFESTALDKFKGREDVCQTMLV